MPGGLKRFALKLIRPYRRITSKNRLLPDFVVIGAQKCGSTSAFRYLVQHPQILASLKKDVRYFSENIDKPLSWYKGHFPTQVEKNMREKKLGKTCITGEATPSYIFCQPAAKKLYEMNPYMKIIALLRNPVDRSFSDHQYGLKRGASNVVGKDFGDRIRAEIEYLNTGNNLEEMFSSEDSYQRIEDHSLLLGMGLYYYQLKNYYDVFPKENIRVYRSEDFFADPAAVLSNMLDFLGLDPFDFPDLRVFNQNKHGKQMDEEMEQLIGEFFEPHNEKLYGLLGERWWDGGE